ncbi:MAG: hypothetical protein EA398_07115 [Deltaproteobacteria bacterium]|nr:MAG: hypothetical protein EA398_07115 [Deltaproteobacteria bacterium]
MKRPDPAHDITPAPPEERGDTAMAILDGGLGVGVWGVGVGFGGGGGAAPAGVNNALVFYYYGSKAGLIDRVLARYYRRHIEALAGALDGGGTLRERMHRLVDAYVSFIEEHRGYPRIVQHQLAGGGPFGDRIRENLRPLFEWTREALSGLAPAEGPTAARHLFVSISAVVTNYYTYAPALAPLWGGDPLDDASLAERRAHLHWVVDALLAQLERDGVDESGQEDAT